MITDPAERYVISSLGWVDHGSVWRFDARTGTTGALPLSDARYLVVREGLGELFTAAHHFNGDRLLITAQSYERPDIAVAQVDVRGWRPAMTGAPAAWHGLQQAHVGYLSDSATGAAGYFVVVIGPEQARVARLDWFDDPMYDHGYQGVVAVATVPETNELLFGVQRSSDLVLCAPNSAAVIRRVRLAGHSGNPEPYVRRHAPEVWAMDYDTVVRVDRRHWQVTGDRFGGDIGEQPRMFLGGLGWPPDERHVVVPRPGSGDVLVVDPVSLSVRQRIQLGRQPLEAVVLPAGQVVARDWKTGDLLLGT
jgi:hypothetical protein